LDKALNGVDRKACDLPDGRGIGGHIGAFQDNGANFRMIFFSVPIRH